MTVVLYEDVDWIVELNERTDEVIISYFDGDNYKGSVVLDVKGTASFVKIKR